MSGRHTVPVQYCGACGTRLVSYLDTERRERWRCPTCGWQWIDAPHPVVLVLAVAPDGDVLYTRRHSWPPGYWGLVAGFVERDETAETAVARELWEETGLHTIGRPEFVCTQPFRSTQLLLLFRVAVGGGAPKAGSDAEVVERGPADPARAWPESPAQALVRWHLAHPIPRDVEAARRSELPR